MPRRARGAAAGAGTGSRGPGAERLGSASGLSAGRWGRRAGRGPGCAQRHPTWRGPRAPDRAALARLTEPGGEREGSGGWKERGNERGRAGPGRGRGAGPELRGGARAEGRGRGRVRGGL